MDQLPGRELLARCARDRSPETWQELLDRFRPSLLAGARRAMNRAGRAARSLEMDDLLQEIYCRLLDRDGRNLRRCRGERDGAVGAYLGRIAESVVTDQLRAFGAAKRGNDRRVEGDDGNGESLAERAMDPTPSPEDRLLFAERRRLFQAHCRRAVGPRSGSRDLEIFQLAVFEGLSSREISALLNGKLRPSTIDSLVHRMRRRLARQGIHVGRRS